MEELTLRQKAARLLDAGFCRLYLTLLLKQTSISRDDVKFVNEMYDIVFNWKGQPHVDARPFEA
jgi:hypothetical protein